MFGYRDDGEARCAECIFFQRCRCWKGREYDEGRRVKGALYEFLAPPTPRFRAAADDDDDDDGGWSRIISAHDYKLKIVRGVRRKVTQRDNGVSGGTKKPTFAISTSTALTASWIHLHTSGCRL